ncbi:MAG: hypothetical protein KGJ84_16240 [Elusimicrobia bacterium]|nr:hypothetical protein [Elusimicrobiota bacterium]
MNQSTGWSMLLTGALAAGFAAGQDSISNQPAPNANPQAPDSGTPPIPSTQAVVNTVRVDTVPFTDPGVVPVQPEVRNLGKDAKIARAPARNPRQELKALRAARAAVRGTRGVKISRVSGALILTGTVGTQDEKDSLGKKAAAAAGSEPVENRLIVK